MRITPLLIAAALLPALPFAHAQIEGVVTETPIQVDRGKGAHFAPRVRGLIDLIREKRFDEADDLAKALCKDFEALFQRDRRQYAFQTRADFEQFQSGTKEQIEWIDWGYKMALQIQAFVAAERKQYDAALTSLSRLEMIAPVSAETAIETGYALNRLGRSREALAAYGRARAISDKFESQRPYLPMILRGVGFSHIELGDLDKAEKAFLESLQLEPGNKVALHELDYIRSKRTGK